MKQIKIPADFTSLHDLGDLVNNYTVMSKLQNLLNNYQEAYFNSFLKRLDQIYEYIPEKDLKKYQFKIDNYYFEIDDNAVWFSNKKHKSVNILNDLVIDKIKKICDYYIIDTKNKEVIGIHKDYELENDYTDMPKYVIDLETNILSVIINFQKNNIQYIGGCWINGRRGYLSGDYTTLPYIQEGYYKYRFNTLTNTFIDYEYYIDPEKEWQPIKSRF